MSPFTRFSSLGLNCASFAFSVGAFFSAVSALSPANALAELCSPGSAFSSPITALPSDASWRSASTQPRPSGEFSATSPAREKQIENSVRGMETFILTFKGDYGTGDTPPMNFYAADGVKVSFVTRSSGQKGTLTRIQVSGLGAEGKLEGSLLLPVSGHRGNDFARAWAKSDTYSILSDSSRDAEGKAWGPYYNASKLTPVVKNVKSLDLVTIQEVQIPLNTAHATRLYYFRSGSTGPAGYEEGRIIEILWDGT